MLLKELSITNLRNLKTMNLQFHPKINVLCGANGSGKTSILESIYFLATGRSFRTSKANNLINFNHKFMAINAKYTDQHLRQEIKISVIKASDEDKVGKIGGAIANTAQIATLIPTQIINDSTSNLIFKEPDIRRKFLDWIVFYSNQNYHALWKNFNKSLQQRNKLLKLRFGKTNKILDQSDQVFVALAENIANVRHKVWQAFKIVYQEMINNLDLDHMLYPEIELKQGWQGDLLAKLVGNYANDSKLGATGYGPHKADLKIFINEHPAKNVVSKGQGKVLALALMLARAQFITHIAEREDFASVLLVDDLYAELDQANMHKMIKAMLELTEHVQIFITAIDERKLFGVLPRESSSWFVVDQGAIKQILH
jgi:DNA replication and repair protein RecF